ncbi:MAG: glycine--tRNA ligase [Bdellovibrionota bacterium]
MADTLQDLVSLAKRRGFVFQSSEIYGGLNSCWDYGPLGVALKKNVKDRWWKSMTSRLDVVGLDASILMAPRVWEASGHVENFTDPLVDCKKCRSRFREDKAPKTDDGKVKCPNCGSLELSEARNFNLMFKTHMGPVEDSGAVVYLRPETAQGIYVNFLNVASSLRMQVPFGIAQIGKAFRNEITPGNFTFRTREFEQMEMQFFIHASEDDKWFDFWRETRLNWHYDLGLRKEKIRFSPHKPGALAHYAKAAGDVEYEFPFGWDEIEGVHNRTNFDLTRHEEYSKKNLHYVDPKRNNEKYLPYIIETSVGADRCTLAVLLDAYVDDKANERIVLKLNPEITPIQVAVFPLMKKEGMDELAMKIVTDLQNDFSVDYDASGSIGKRYRRQDEVGTPYCVTVDFDTIEKKTVTVRERDSMAQEVISLDQLPKYLKDKIYKK